MFGRNIYTRLGDIIKYDIEKFKKPKLIWIFSTVIFKLK